MGDAHYLPQPPLPQVPEPALAKAGGAVAKDWLAAREADLLPVGYFHVIVPGGGISLDGMHWVRGKPGFLLPVPVLSRLFRRLFLAQLADAHAEGRLSFFDEIEGRRRRNAFVTDLAPLRRKNWFVYAKPPFAGPDAGLAYRRASAIDRSVNRARRPGRGHRRRCRSSPAMPLLRRAHDHCRELRVRRRTPRPAVTPTQQRQRSAMTPVTASAHLPPAGNASGAASLSPHPLQKHTTHPRSGQNRPLDHLSSVKIATAIVLLSPTTPVGASPAQPGAPSNPHSRRPPTRRPAGSFLGGFRTPALRAPANSYDRAGIRNPSPVPTYRSSGRKV